MESSVPSTLSRTEYGKRTNDSNVEFARANGIIRTLWRVAAKT